MYECPEIRPKILKIQPNIPEILVILEIWPKLSETRLENLGIRREISEIRRDIREMVWNPSMRPEIL